MLDTWDGSTRVSRTFTHIGIKPTPNENSTSTCAAIRERDFTCALHSALREEGIRAETPSVNLSLEFFLALPLDIPIPEISADPDGEIAFDWYGGKNWIFSVSFSGKNRYSFASLRGLNETSGTRWFDDSIPLEILKFIRDVSSRA